HPRLGLAVGRVEDQRVDRGVEALGQLDLGGLLLRILQGDALGVLGLALLRRGGRGSIQRALGAIADEVRAALEARLHARLGGREDADRLRALLLGEVAEATDRGGLDLDRRHEGDVVVARDHRVAGDRGGRLALLEDRLGRAGLRVPAVDGEGL
ncbi:MAG: hypothetical protein ACK56I_13010, partial [bacterium]